MVVSGRACSALIERRARDRYVDDRRVDDRRIWLLPGRGAALRLKAMGLERQPGVVGVTPRWLRTMIDEMERCSHAIMNQG
jgi:hypothetical protein